MTSSTDPAVRDRATRAGTDRYLDPPAASAAGLWPVQQGSATDR